MKVKSNRGWSGLSEFSKDLYTNTYFSKFKNENYEQWLERTTQPYSNDEEHKNRIKTYIRNYWFHGSTPISSGVGYPIACYVSHIEDNNEDIFDKYKEGMFLGAGGGGRGVNWSDVRGSGSNIKKTGTKSSGIIPFLGISDRATYGISQAGTRRSSETAYLHISHPDIKDFLDIKLETGDRNRRTPNLHHAIVIPDSFMNAVENLQQWDLICPKTGEVVDSVDAYDLFINICYIRKTESGEPNLLFIDNVNRQSPKEYKVKNLKVSCSNICTEIMLYTDKDTTAVCCLGSINLKYWDEILPNIDVIVGDVSDFLDNVLTKFLDDTDGKEGFDRARNSVINCRDIGIGVMGFHSLLQNKMIPMSSPMAIGLNNKIFSKLRQASDKHQSTLPISSLCPLSIQCGTHRRNIHTIAIAPTMSISSLCDVTSSGIEPWMSNAFVKKVPTGTYTIKNRELEKIMVEYNDNIDWIEEQWSNILKNDGSVQQLHWLSDYEKEVFLTAYELDQRVLLKLASDRVEYIDQGQSLNLFVPAKISYEELFVIHMTAWRLGIKSLYYLRSMPAANADITNKERHAIVLEDDTCVSCT